jgi:hypothetical protein
MLELHWIDELSEPSLSSVAEPENVTESPCVNSEPDEGDDMETVGEEFACGLIVIEICLELDVPLESVAVAVMV